MNNRLRAGAMVGALALASLALTACSGGSADTGADGKPIVRFSGLKDPAPIPALFMHEQGIDKKHGFTAEVKPMDPDSSQTSFLMGESDIAVDMDAVAAAIARNQGHNVVSFYPALTNTAGVVVAKDSKYKSPKDLVGQQVGHFGVDSGTTQSVALTMDEFYGVDPIKDYKLTEAGPPALPELLAAGEVQAIFDFEPFPLRAVEITPGRYLMKVAKVWQKKWNWSPPIAMLTAKDEWLQDNPDLAKNVVAAWKESAAKISDSGYKAFAKEPYKSFLNLKNAKETQALIDYCKDLPCYPTKWNEQTVDKTHKYLELMAERESILKKMPDDPAAVYLKDYDATK